ncbi:MAG: cytochrome c-type biogenesis protein CcmH [Gemmatimonadetes bacterium]|nr:cytochrome c-type biogenesis protein CcmH [Gemmatimonadota bacterium]
MRAVRWYGGTAVRAAVLALALGGRADAQARERADAATPSGVSQSPTARPPARLTAPSSTDSLGRLYAPNMVQSRAPVTARDNDALVKAIEGKLRCTCGCNLDVFTCRTTDFSCATSPAMHRQVLARLDSAMTPQQIVAAFEAQYGQAVLMAPPKRGFNWAAYIMPFVGLGVGIAIVGLVMRRWIRARPATLIEVETPPPGVGVAGQELERLKRELERFEA